MHLRLLQIKIHARIINGDACKQHPGPFSVFVDNEMFFMQKGQCRACCNWTACIVFDYEVEIYIFFLQNI